MGIFDKARDAVAEHGDKIDPLVDRIAAEADQRSGGRHRAKIDRAADLGKDKRGEHARGGTTPEPGAPA
jgi:hypothetical protein